MNIVVDERFRAHWSPAPANFGELRADGLSELRARIELSGGTIPHRIASVTFVGHVPLTAGLTLVRTTTTLAGDTVQLRVGPNTPTGAYSGLIRAVVQDSSPTPFALTLDLAFTLQVVSRPLAAAWIPQVINFGELMPDTTSAVSARIGNLTGGVQPYAVGLIEFFGNDLLTAGLSLVRTTTAVTGDTVQVRAGANTAAGAYNGVIRATVRDSAAVPEMLTLDLPFTLRVPAPPIEAFAAAVGKLEGGRGPRIWYRMSGPGPGIPNQGSLGTQHNLTVGFDGGSFNGRYQQPGVPILSSPSEGQTGAVSGPTVGYLQGGSGSWTSGHQGTWIVVINFAGSTPFEWIGGQGWSSDREGVQLRTRTDNHFIFLVQSTGNDDFWRNVANLDPNPLDDGAFHVIAIRKNANTSPPDLFLDGLQIPDENIVDQNNGAPGDYWFDNISRPGSEIFRRYRISRQSKFGGSIDEWIVTDDVMTDAAILELSMAALADA